MCEHVCACALLLVVVDCHFITWLLDVLFVKHNNKTHYRVELHIKDFVFLALPPPHPQSYIYAFVRVKHEHL